MRNKIFAFFLLFPCSFFSQTGWTWTELDTMPEGISNNAVSEGTDSNGVVNVYSFAGINNSKIHSGISLKSFRYNTVSGIWDTLAPLPDTMGKIAVSANTVNNKIYIIGGYHVKANGSEVSSSKVHIFDPVSNAYLPDGTDIPVPIDDQVQCVWRDSLIYVITGWSNTTNVPNVQIYNPSLNTWSVGTSTPNSIIYKMFGASGVIIGDTIYYNGGSTSGFNFVSVPYLRKGIIDANDPTQIIWTQEQNNPGAAGYRMAAAKYNNRCFWIGGSGTAYNYDGVAYNGTGGVEPLTRILAYESEWKMWFEGLGAPFGVMDLRGIAQTSATSWIICGGMSSGQQVSNKTFLLEFDPIIGGLEEQKTMSISVHPNPTSDFIKINSTFETNANYQVISITGQVVKQGFFSQTIAVHNLEKGVYSLIISDSKNRYIGGFIKE